MLQKSSIHKTMDVFFSNPTKLHYLAYISRKIKVAHTSVKKNLDGLKASGLIIESSEKKGKRRFPLYMANINNKSFKKQKSIYNLASIIDSNLIKFIEEKLAPKSIVLFGSYQKGEDTENSDIDLFVECRKESIDISKFEKLIGRKIELHFNENFTSYPKELKNNIINGIVLSGFLEGYK